MTVLSVEHKWSIRTLAKHAFCMLCPRPVNLPGAVYKTCKVSGDWKSEFFMRRWVPLDWKWFLTYLVIEDSARPIAKFQIHTLP